MPISFVDIDRVLQVHLSMIDRYGGEHGLRDIALLQSAVAMPQTSFEGQFLHNDVFEMAAAYLFHIVQNHPFVDGNKRTGTAAAIIFLALNNVQIEPDEDELVNLTISVARGEVDKSKIAEFFRHRAV